VSFADKDKQCQAICAFSNDLPNHRQPGYLFVGVDDKTGEPVASTVSDRNLQSLAGIRSDGNIQPLPRMNVESLKHPHGEVAVVEVFPSDLPPIRYRGQVWIRVGPRRAIASETEERILAERRVARARTWDARPCRGARLEDLALELFMVGYRQYAVAPEILEENNRSASEQLAALRFFDLDDQCPTHAAVLLFGKDPLYFVPGAYVQYVGYRGRSQAEPVASERRFQGDLRTVLAALDQLAEDLAQARPVPGEGLTERIVYRYPPTALHELLVNAVVHRNYEGSTTPVFINHFEDRIEILSPGGLFGELTPADFPRGTAYRNPVLAEAAKTLGFVNRFGRGIAIAQSALEKNGSPPAEFDLSNFFLVVVRRRP
jgi:ATP-dependent DNA helicase RecG